MDYTTHYPEALTLQKATSKAIAQELVLLFSRRGNLHEPGDPLYVPPDGQLMPIAAGAPLVDVDISPPVWWRDSTKP